MPSKQEEFLKELLADFQVEAQEHWGTITNGLLEIEKQPDGDHNELVEVIFRAVHSLKGASRAVNIVDVEQLCQSMESVMALLKNKKISFSPTLFDAMHDAVNLLETILSNVGNDKKTYSSNRVIITLQGLTVVQSTSSKKTKYSPPQINTVNSENLPSIEKPIQQLIANTNAEVLPLDVQTDNLYSAGASEEPKERAGVKETVRIGTDKLNSLLLQSEELITAKAMFRNNLDELKQFIRNYNAQAKTMELALQAIVETSQEHRVAYNDIYGRQKDVAKNMRQNFSTILKNTENLQRGFARTIDDLLLDVRKTLLVPFSSLLNIYPKLVRDLSKNQKKEVNLIVSGADVEIDRRILEELKDPLIHLIRNCIDHGIELPNERKAIGKCETGKIAIDVLLTSDRRIIITVSDDGCGISVDKVVASAITEGLISADNAADMSDKKKAAFIFRSGVSTSSFITNISGRGLGMAIVAEKVARLGGTIDMDTKTGEGTQFIISVPLTLATFRGILVNVSGYLYMVPINTIERVMRIRPTDITTVKAHETIVVDGTHIGIMRLSNVLSLSRKHEQLRKSIFNTIVLAVGQKRMAFIVDDILGEHEGIVKSLGTQLFAVRNISGATVLGDGKVTPVINASDLIEYSLKAQTSVLAETLPSDETPLTANGEQKRILVVEDSLTSRSLLRNIFEAAGYFVKTTVDGAEAFATLNSERFDIVVSDVEMPRMNGFDLTQKIRDDDKLSSMPIVLITSLETAHDKQKGLEAGANAYFVKSSFDQTNIIEVIERLI